MPEQTRDYLLPSVLSHNAKLLHSRSTNIIERLDWLNSQPRDAADNLHEHADVSTDLRVTSRFSLNERLRVSQVEADVEGNTSEKTLPQIEKATGVTREERQTLEIERMKSDCEKLRSDIDNIQAEMKKINAQLFHATLVQEAEEKELEARETERLIKSRTYDLMEDSENSIAKLRAVIESGRNKLYSLANQWEKHRAPLIKQYRDGREKYSAITVSISTH